jgi:hypothetical protein
MAGLGKVESCVRGFFVAALFNAALDFFNWNFFVVAQQRMIRRYVRTPTPTPTLPRSDKEAEGTSPELA